MIVLLDYGMGNLRSVQRALARLGAASCIAPDFQTDQKVILPGVGAFAAAMERIGEARADRLRAHVHAGGALMGICLGQQLLFERSEEGQGAKGLGILPGEVRYLPRDGVKVPHVGWNELEFPRPSSLMAGLGPASDVYFVHSLVCHCQDRSDVVATSIHGFPFVAAVQRGRIWGTQFHPEKSGDVGLRILENFLTC